MMLWEAQNQACHSKRECLLDQLPEQSRVNLRGYVVGPLNFAEQSHRSLAEELRQPECMWWNQMRVYIVVDQQREAVE